VRIGLSSQKTNEQAERGWEELRKAYGDLLGNLQPSIREVDLGAEKGVWYRLYAGPVANRADAQVLCAKIKSQPPKSNCLIVVE
jgi:hypothetical protein